jgi:hypothetical protein
VEFEPRRKDNLFLWTVFLLLLVGMSMGCWIGSYLIFNRPELPLSYRILRKLKKIDLPQRFKVSAAPQGEFLTAEKLYERYNRMSPSELREINRQLERSFLRNYPVSAQTVPYVKGLFTILNSYELKPTDFFPAGVVVLAVSADYPKLMIEHVYSADASVAPLIKRNLQTGMDIELRRTYDLTAVVQITKLPNGVIQLTTVPLNYGSYAFTGASGGFSLEPPLDLRVSAGWPLIRNERREEANREYLAYRQRNGLGAAFFKPRTAEASKPPETAIKGVDAPLSPPPTPALAEPSPAPTPAIAQASPAEKPSKDPKKPAVAAASPAATPPALAQNTPPPREEIQVRKALPVNAPVLAVQRPASTPPPVIKALPQGPSGTLQPFLSASAVGGNSSSTIGTGTTGGTERSWPTYAPGRAPSGKNIRVNEVSAYAQRIGQTGEPMYYLNGQFVVRAVGENKAKGIRNAVLRSSTDSNVRIIVEYPSDRPLPVEGSAISRDEQRPYQITGVRQVGDGTLNVFAREITSQ